MLRLCLIMARKDLALLLLRSSGLVQAVLLGLVLVFVFSLSAGVGERPGPQAAATLFWLCSLFCQVLVFNQLYALEEAAHSRPALALVPAPIQGVWLGKALAGLVLLLLSQALFLPAIIVFLGQGLSGPVAPALLALVLVDAGLCALGSLLGALAQGQAARESLLSVVLFPLLTPVLLAGIAAWTQALGQVSADGVGSWLGVAAAFDAIFFGAGLLLFAHLYPGED